MVLEATEESSPTSSHSWIHEREQLQMQTIRTAICIGTKFYKQWKGVHYLPERVLPAHLAFSGEPAHILGAFYP